MITSGDRFLFITSAYPEEQLTISIPKKGIKAVRTTGPLRAYSYAYDDRRFSLSDLGKYVERGQIEQVAKDGREAYIEPLGYTANSQMCLTDFYVYGFGDRGGLNTLSAEVKMSKRNHLIRGLSTAVEENLMGKLFAKREEMSRLAQTRNTIRRRISLRRSQYGF